MTQHANEVSPIHMRDCRHACVPKTASECDRAQKLRSPVLARSACSGEKQAGRQRKGNGARSDNNAHSPAVEKFQQPGESFCPELALEIGLACVAREAEGEIRADHRTCSCS